MNFTLGTNISNDFPELLSMCVFLTSLIKKSKVITNADGSQQIVPVTDFFEKYGTLLKLGSVGATVAAAAMSDEEKEMLQAYNAWGEKNNYGKKYMGIIRSTAIISPDGTLLKHWKTVRGAEDHPLKVLEALKELQA